MKSQTQNEECDIVILNCNNKEDNILLSKIKKIAKDNEIDFKPGYAFELYTACEYFFPDTSEFFFVAIKRDKNNELNDICGFARLTSGSRDDSSIILIETLASKSYTNKLYKGVGTKLIKSIINYFKDDSNIAGIRVDSHPEAIDFYLKVGFERVGSSISRNLFISFDNLRN